MLVSSVKIKRGDCWAVCGSICYCLSCHSGIGIHTHIYIYMYFTLLYLYNTVLHGYAFVFIASMTRNQVHNSSKCWNCSFKTDVQKWCSCAGINQYHQYNREFVLKICLTVTHPYMPLKQQQQCHPTNTLIGTQTSAILVQCPSQTTFPTDWPSEELCLYVASSRSRLHLLASCESLGVELMEQWKQKA